MGKKKSSSMKQPRTRIQYEMTVELEICNQSLSQMLYSMFQNGDQFISQFNETESVNEKHKQLSVIGHHLCLRLLLCTTHSI